MGRTSPRYETRRQKAASGKTLPISILLVAADPDDETHCILAVTKCNLAAKPQSLTFMLERLPNDICRIAPGQMSGLEPNHQTISD
jgi:hypothetical protein